MKKALRILGVVLGVLALAGMTAYAFANAPEKDSMGVWGYVAGAKYANLELSDKQLGGDKLVLDRVVAPESAWVVVHLDDDGMPGERVGLTHVSAGENANVEVTLKDVTSDKVIVALHADKATQNKFDFDMENKETSPDRPFFVDKAEVAKVVTVSEFGVKAEAGTAAIEVADQPGVTGTLLVKRAVAPTGAWVVVHLDDDGMPGERIGSTQIPAGDTANVSVALDPKIMLGDSLLVAVHADRGALGTFEFDMEDKLNSPDQPFFVDGNEVATKVAVK